MYCVAHEDRTESDHRRSETKGEYVEWRTVANADHNAAGNSKRAYGRMRWEGSMYHLTGGLYPLFRQLWNIY